MNIAIACPGFVGMTNAAQVVKDIDVVNTWRTHFETIGVSKSHLKSLAQRLDGDELPSQH